jgi:hypothetical protein
VVGAVLALQRNGDDRLGLVRVADRIAAGRLRRRPPGVLAELEGAAIAASAADGLGITTGLAAGGPVGPALLLAGGAVPDSRVLALVVAALLAAAADRDAAAGAGAGSAEGTEGEGGDEQGERDENRRQESEFGVRNELRGLLQFALLVARTGLADGLAPESL